MKYKYFIEFLRGLDLQKMEQKSMYQMAACRLCKITPEYENLRDE